MVLLLDFTSRSVSASQIKFGSDPSVLDVSSLDSERGYGKGLEVML
jgi:hypothetical protein